MERRSFLGLILGTLTTGINFVAEELKPVESINPFDLYSWNKDQLMQCKGAICLDDGKFYKCTKIKEVNKDRDKIKFIFEPINCKEIFTIFSTRLLGPNNEFILEHQLAYKQTLTIGDTFYGTYTLNYQL